MARLICPIRTQAGKVTLMMPKRVVAAVLIAALVLVGGGALTALLV